mmetsp:Transcript_2345/g.6817  ORF Transcript_2345/g.6817 Transcript_2345/m.6817 type:complete len:614 (+) Transcript_2345:86-1927(+)|eukprot:CAMPEP_0181058070 /NCGR_PEP_ID=MMETSP1070-20121207/20603_1 /TAXON_ID=265543 /ORGANISM="Minutocellus polymorphus, Strain NH13" /LENGTH=613 /DNA_ID=CAMNT_0023137557 /DNA_START=28 /DNA_END=1869 /DNA_ORIENTATION=-
MSNPQEVGEIFGSGEGFSTALLRSPTVLIASIGFWGMNIYWFRRIGIDHVRVLLLDLVKEREEQQKAGGGSGSASAGGGGILSKLSRARRKRGLPTKGSGTKMDEDVAQQHHPRGDGAGDAAALKGVGSADRDVSDKQSDCGDALPDDDDMLDHGGDGHSSGTGGTARRKRVGEVEMTGLTNAADNNRDGFVAEDDTTLTGTTPSTSASASPMGSGSDGHAASGADGAATGDDIGSPSKAIAPTSGDSTIAAELKAPSHEVTSVRCFVLCAILLVLLFSTNYVWLNLLGGGTVGAVFAFYALVSILILTPLPSTRWIRVATMTVLRRVAELVNPRCFCLTGDLRPVPFIDVFVADAMCSLSKVFFDWGMMLHLASHYPDPVPPSVHAIIIPSMAASWPYVCRARQCLIMHEVGRRKNDPKRYQHLLNALKYSSSLFPLCVSAYQKTLDDPVKAAQVDKILIILIVINSLYCLAWDIIMDWGMMDGVFADSSCVPSGGSSGGAIVGSKGWSHHCLRPRLRFGFAMSFGILLSDCVLRFAWLLRFVEHVVFPNNGSYILWTQILEAFRRGIWNLLRVEWENIKQSKAKKRVNSRVFDDEEAPFIAPKSISLNRAH